MPRPPAPPVSADDADIADIADTADKAVAARHPYLAVLGERVRTLRQRRGMTRKALSAAAAVSERHLANLEVGLGNASILVLLQVAQALQCPLASLLDDGSAPSRAGAARPLRVALIGLRGAGKSTLGGMLADALELPFIELSREVERLAGCRTGEILALYGQTAYRRYERRALQEALRSHAQAVIATPGGLVSDAGSFDLLLAQCRTVWLRASPKDHMERVLAQGDLRPMSASREAMDDLRRILASREALYARASLHLDTSAQPLPQTFALLRAQLLPA